MSKYINNEIELNSRSSDLAKTILSEVDQFIIIVFSTHYFNAYQYSGFSIYYLLFCFIPTLLHLYLV